MYVFHSYRSMMNTTLSAPLEMSSMPDQKLQDRCRRLESQHSTLTRHNNELTKSLKEKTEALKTIQPEKNAVERKLAESVADLTVSITGLSIQICRAVQPVRITNSNILKFKCRESVFCFLCCKAHGLPIT